MSMSTPGPERVPSTVKVDKTSGQGKPPAGRPSGAKKSTPKGKGGGKGRKPVTPVKVAGGRNWGPIIVAAVVVLLAGGIIGYGVYAAAKSSNDAATPWEERADAIKGIVNYRDNPDKTITARNHKPGVLTYKTSPPVGGDHNPRWENCMGDVYDQPIPVEHAVHSLEHGAVWLTYKQGLPADQVDKLKGKIQGQPYSLMSPIANLDKNVSLQAWGYQLKLDSVDDTRIDEFIKALRQNATVEPQAICSNGVTAVGTTPQDS
ncbi:DUF3105 domain-containing protein [Actinoplanes sp. NPDC049265]|uniref:DUF3105 domain-containing protein n=1 Tax=Actinoplanes sp. NPDC049265 TaxID=3363902 RepID=UPI00371784B4